MVAAVDSTVLIALIVAFSGLTGPLLLAYLTGRQRRSEKDQDYARQDAVAKAAAAVADAQAAAAEQAVRERHLLLARQEEAAAQVKQVHALVNSNLTAQIEARLDATKRELVALLEIVDLKKASKKRPTKDAVASIEAAHEQITALEKELAKRAKEAATAAKVAEEGAAATQVAAAEKQSEAADRQGEAADRQGAAAEKLAAVVHGTAEAAAPAE